MTTVQSYGNWIVNICKIVISSFPWQNNVTSFHSCKIDISNSVFYCNLPVWFLSKIFSDFYMRSEGKSVKFSVKTAQDSPGKDTIYGRKFGNNEVYSHVLLWEERRFAANPQSRKQASYITHFSQNLFRWKKLNPTHFFDIWRWGSEHPRNSSNAFFLKLYHKK